MGRGSKCWAMTDEHSPEDNQRDYVADAMAELLDAWREHEAQPTADSMRTLGETAKRLSNACGIS